MSTASNYQPRYSVGDYADWDGDWELWNGVAVSMSPSPSPLHQSISGNLYSEIRNQLKSANACEQCVALFGTDWQVADHTVVRPDVLITCDPLPEKHVIQPPVFVAEILSPSTADKDRTVKRALYQSEGVKYYTLIDPIERTVESLALDGATYRLCSSKPLVLQLTEVCQISIDLNSVFS